MRGTELGVGHETSLGAGEGVGVRAGRMNCHCEQTHRNTLACGHQHVHLARRRVRVDAERLIDQVVGSVSHCGDHDGHVIAGVLRFDDASGHALDRFWVATEEPPNFCTMRATTYPIFFNVLPANILSRLVNYRKNPICQAPARPTCGTIYGILANPPRVFSYIRSARVFHDRPRNVCAIVSICRQCNGCGEYDVRPRDAPPTRVRA